MLLGHLSNLQVFRRLKKQGAAKYFIGDETNSPVAAKYGIIRADVKR